MRGLPFIMYAPRVGGWGQASYTFPLCTCNKGVGGWVQIACKIAYVLNGRPLTQVMWVTQVMQETRVTWVMRCCLSLIEI